MSSPARTLLTGFGPFLDVDNNPSARIVEHFMAHGAPGHHITGRILPVSFGWVRSQLPVLLKDGAFDAVLLLGVARRDTEIRLEQQARNHISGASPDIDGWQPPEGPIVAGAPDAYPAGLPCDSLLHALRENGIPARASDSAGGYVCNFAYFTALSAIARYGLPTRALFIHVPGSGVPLFQQMHAVGLALERLASLKNAAALV